MYAAAMKSKKENKSRAVANSVGQKKAGLMQRKISIAKGRGLNGFELEIEEKPVTYEGEEGTGKLLLTLSRLKKNFPRERRDDLKKDVLKPETDPYDTYDEMMKTYPPDVKNSMPATLGSPTDIFTKCNNINNVYFPGNENLAAIESGLDGKTAKTAFVTKENGGLISEAKRKGVLEKVYAQFFLAEKFYRKDLRAGHLAGSCTINFSLTKANVSTWADDKQVIKQSPQMRGDMHDVLLALALEKNLRVAVCGGGAFQDTGCGKNGGYKDAYDILSFYWTRRNQATVTGEDQSAVAGEGIFYATQVLYDKRLEDPQNSRKIMKEEIGGPSQEELGFGPRYEKDLQDANFRKGPKYCIINYRDSGHKPGEGRDPSHPELDTGQDGFWEFVILVQKKNMRPVPMGLPPEEADPPWKTIGAHLIEYWKWPSCDTSRDDMKVRSNRQAEYGLLRYLGDNYNVSGLSMRSGVTDAMVFAGIPTISIDVAHEGVTEKEYREVGLSEDLREDISWRRAAMREIILMGEFHQGFLKNLRSEPIENSDSWSGLLGKENLSLLDETFKKVFFSSSKKPVTEPLPGSPLLTPIEFVKKIPGSQKKSFGCFLEKMERDRILLRRELYD